MCMRGNDVPKYFCFAYHHHWWVPIMRMHIWRLETSKQWVLIKLWLHIHLPFTLYLLKFIFDWILGWFSKTKLNILHCCLIIRALQASWWSVLPYAGCSMIYFEVSIIWSRFLLHLIKSRANRVFMCLHSQFSLISSSQATTMVIVTGTVTTWKLVMATVIIINVKLKQATTMVTV